MELAIPLQVSRARSWFLYHKLHAFCAAEPEYAEELIKHAKQMLEFGLAHPGSYMTSKQEGLKDHSKHYPSSNYNDEMAWGALWLHLATEVSLPPWRFAS